MVAAGAGVVVDLHIAMEILDEGFMASMTKLEEAIGPASLTTFMATVAEPWQQAEISARFADERDPSGATWQPLSFAAQEDRESQGFDREHPILKRTGELQTWLESSNDVTTLPIGAQIEFPGEAGSDEAREKYVVNQTGTMSGNHHFGWRVPARAMLGFNEGDLTEVLALLEAWIWI